MVMWYWSADTPFWQSSIDHNMDVENQVEGSHISRKCDISLWLPCSSDGRVDGQTYGHVTIKITRREKFSQLWKPAKNFARSAAILVYYGIWLWIPLWCEGRELKYPKIGELKNTWTAIEFHSHCYGCVPSLRKYPDVTCSDWLAQCLVNNGISVIISIKQLSKHSK